MRTAAQLISYEVPLVLAVLALSMLAGSLNLVEIVRDQGRVPFIVWQPLGFFLFMAAAVSDLTRRPFDVAAAESEVAGGPWIEFSGIRWSILYALTEYTNMFALCVLGSLIFLGGWDWPLGLKLGWWWQLVLIFAKTMTLILVVMWMNAHLPAHPRRPAHVVLLEAAAAAGVRADLPQRPDPGLSLARLDVPCDLRPGAGWSPATSSTRVLPLGLAVATSSLRSAA